MRFAFSCNTPSTIISHLNQDVSSKFGKVLIIDGIYKNIRIICAICILRLRKKRAIIWIKVYKERADKQVNNFLLMVNKMNWRKPVILLLTAVMLFVCSCQNGQGGMPDGEISESPDLQRMAYHLGDVSVFGDDIYFVANASFGKADVFACEYGTEDFEIFIPCFDAVCNHTDRMKCCALTSRHDSIEQCLAFLYNGEPALLLFNPVDTWLSRPYSNFKVNLMHEDIVNHEFPDDAAGIMEYLEIKKSIPKRSELLVYGNYLYYVEIKNGVRTQYRISLEGGEPERVFEEDNVIIRTIINDRFYGIKYDINGATEENDILPTRDQIHYFRSDMNYENIESLAENMEFFTLLSDDVTNNFIILEADEEFIYTMRGTKILAFSDSDINAEPILLSDMEGKIPGDLPAMSWIKWNYYDGTVYCVVNTGIYKRELLDINGFETSRQWYESSILYSFDIRTGECKELDISNENYLIDEIFYADDKYVYAEGRYVHDDNRVIQGVTMRLTLDTMRYEVILPDRFWEYSAETNAE